MNYIPQINRRTFVVSAAAVGGGLMLGMDIPLGPHARPRRGRLAGSQCLGRDPA